MSIETTSLISEIEDVINGPATPTHFIWEVEILLPDDDEIVPIKVQDVDIISNYHSNYTDVWMVTLSVLQGELDYQLFPNKDNLKITLFKRPVYEQGTGRKVGAPAYKKTFKAVLTTTQGAALENNDPQISSQNQANHQAMVDISIQCVDRAMEQMKYSLVGGTYLDNVPADVLRAILTQTTKVKSMPMSEKPKGVDMVEPDNTALRNTIVVRQGLPLIDLPDYIQQQCGGVYNSGLGYYYSRGIWYVYPEFNVKLFDRARRRITILNVPNNKYPELERTYRQDGDNLVIISTGGVSYVDDSNERQLNSGNGVRFANAEGFIDGFVSLDGNKATTDRTGRNNEFKAFSRDDGINNAPVTGQRITGNPYAQKSLLAARNLARLMVTWENANETLITPGMGVKYRYVANGNVREVKGILASAQTHAQPQGTAINADRHRTSTVLTFFVDRSIKL